MTQRVRQVWHAIGSFLTPQPGVCVQCHRAVGFIGGIVVHLPKEGMDLEFCSQYCENNYWKDYKKHCQRTAGTSLCSLPGCNKPCYQEGYKTHDYCGRTHAKEHKAMMDAMERDRRKQHHSGWGPGQVLGGSSFSGSSRQSGPIKFYNRGEPYYEFTNFFEVVIEIDGKHWPTSEHYFQSQKFVGTPIVETIRMLSRPREAFDLSRDPRYSRWRRPDWEEVKEDVMYKALQAKFSQHPRLRQMLLDTGERKLIEHSPYDSYWGDGGDGTGKNRLGYLLGKLRGEMKAKKKESRPSSSPHSVPKQHGVLDKEPIAGLSVEPSSKPAGQSYANKVQGGSSGGASPHGQPCKPDVSDKWLQEHHSTHQQQQGHTHQWHQGHTHQQPQGYAHQQQHAQSPRQPGANSGNFAQTQGMVISNMGAGTQPPPSTTPQSHSVTFTSSPQFGANIPSTTPTSNTSPSMPNQSQVPHTQTPATYAPHGLQSQQPQLGPTQGPVVQASSAVGPTVTYAMQLNTGGQPTPAAMSGMTGMSQQPLQHNPMSSNMTMSQQPVQPSPMGTAPVSPNPVLLNTVSHFPQDQQQQPALSGFETQPSSIVRPFHMAQGNTSQHMSFGTAMPPNMPQYAQQCRPMGSVPVGLNQTPPPPGFTQPGGAHIPATNQFHMQSSNAPYPVHTPNGAHPQYSSGASTQPPGHTMASGLPTQSSFQPGMQQQANLHPQAHNRPKNNSPDEPMDLF